MISVVPVGPDGGVLDFVDRFMEKSRLLRVGDRTFARVQRVGGSNT